MYNKIFRTALKIFYNFKEVSNEDATIFCSFIGCGLDDWFVGNQ